MTKMDANDLAKIGGPAEVLRGFDAAAPQPAKPASPRGRSRRGKHLRDARGKALPVLANALTALEADPDLVGCFGYDDMLRAPMLLKNLPGSAIMWDGPRMLTDVDVGVAQEHLQHRGLPRLSKDIAHQAIDIRARERSFHPVRDYLNALVWDGVSRIESWLEKYLGCAASEYTRAVGRMFLVMMVARIFKPGCKADYMLVLEGAQGAHKSTACAILGGDWFSDSLPDVTSGKDLSQHLAGKWLIEIAELSAMSKSDSAALKAFVTREVERYRPSYGRKEVIEPRQCAFIGTTNKTTYLRDETGGRRFWPVEVANADLDALRRDRDQLFAEAVSRYRAGTAWWPDAQFEALHMRPQQERRFEHDAWEDHVIPWLKGRQRVIVGQVLTDCLGIEKGRIGRSDQNRVTAMLERAGWRRLPKHNGNVEWAPIPTDNGLRG